VVVLAEQDGVDRAEFSGGEGRGSATSSQPGAAALGGFPYAPHRLRAAAASDHVRIAGVFDVGGEGGDVGDHAFGLFPVDDVTHALVDEET